ncbi:MAG: nuclear transport factor 2 family protein [Bacteroidota bacterium]
MKKFVLLTISLLFFLRAYAQESKEEIFRILDEQSSCWNKGDFDCFMEAYWNSEELMFIGVSGITYGWEKTFDNYKKNYPNKEARGILSFDILKAQEVTPDVYFVVGKWDLERVKKEGSTGTFTLVWKKISGNWKIISDHSAADLP